MAKWLLTADWQAEWDNLGKCRQVVTEILAVCRREGIRRVIHAGDIKEHYNPVDVRVVNFIIEACERFAKDGIELIALLGNHDRTAMYSSADNWLPVLHSAKATIVTQPQVLARDGYSIFAVPFISEVEELRATLRDFAATAHTAASVLVFHAEVQTAWFNQHTRIAAGNNLSMQDLCARRYKLCLGGHIHRPQHLPNSNVYYIGSPFAQDWRDVNQRKGYWIADIDQAAMQFVPSKIPGYYDPGLPGYLPKAWTGAMVRVHASSQADVEKVCRKAEKQYHGAIIVPVVDAKEVQDDKNQLKMSLDGSDRSLLAQYLHHKGVDSKHVKALLAYILNKLPGKVTTRSKFAFLNARAQNFLSFEATSVDYSQPGIVVVLGQNKDWGNSSNGAGKTGWLQIPIVAIYGTTIKEQECDSWIRQTADPSATAFVEVLIDLPGRGQLRIYRSRRPVKLQVFLNGKDVSTGIGTRHTQQYLEELLGLSKDLFVSALYVDQREVNTFVRGTSKERKQLLGQACGLQRFGDALDVVKTDLKMCRARLQELEEDIFVCRDRLKALTVVSDKRADVEGLQAKIARLQTELDALPPMEGADIGSAEKVEAKLEAIRRQVSDLLSQKQLLKKQLLKVQALGDVCPTCFQKVSLQLRTQMQVKWKKQITGLHAALKKVYVVEQRYRAKQKAARQKEQKRMALESRQTILQTEIDSVKTLLEAHIELAKMQTQNVREQRIGKRALRRLKACQQWHLELQDFLGVASAILSRDGLPAHLMAQLCPQLNAAAMVYSEWFTEKAITVEFIFDGEDIDVHVHNIHGGENIKDQSQGELRMAGMVASFAAREVFSVSNMLILDEPGEGLDPKNATRFAEALQQIARRFGIIFLTTHNAAILSALAPDRVVKIVKSQRVSTAMEVTQ